MISQIIDTILSKPPKNGKFYLVAIDGRGGSGKTSFAAQFIERLPGFTLLNGDDYFEPTPNGPAWGDFNDERFNSEVITPLQTGNSFTHRPYDWHSEPHITDRLITIEKGLVFERCFSMSLPLDWDCTIWIEAPPDVCLERGLAREILPREQVLPVWRDVWQSREDQYIAQSAPQTSATYVVDGARSIAIRGQNPSRKIR